MKKNLITILLMLILLSVGMNAVAADRFVLTLGHGAAPSNPRHTVALELAKYVEAMTNGAVKIKVFPSETLGSDREMAESVAMGALDMSINSQGPIASYNPNLNVVGLPFLFSKPAQTYAVLDGEVGEIISEQLTKKGIRILAYWENGFRHITNNIRPINVPADLEGLKIRTPEDKITLAIFNALGANPAPLAFGELYMALSQGLFDGQENPITNIYYSKLYEVQKYISLTNHKYETCPLVISESTWQKLPEKYQKVLKEAAMKYAMIHRKENTYANNNLLKELKKEGVQVNTADVAALRAATKSVYSKFEPVFGKELVEKVLAIVASVE